MGKFFLNGVEYNGSGGDAGASNLADLEDVDVTGVTDGQIIRYNSTTHKWEATNESGGTITDVKVNNTSVVSGGVANISSFGGASSNANGSSGVVPAPALGDEDKYLKGDGSWTYLRDSKYFVGCLQLSNSFRTPIGEWLGPFPTYSYKATLMDDYDHYLYLDYSKSWKFDIEFISTNVATGNSQVLWGSEIGVARTPSVEIGPTGSVWCGYSTNGNDWTHSVSINPGYVQANVRHRIVIEWDKIKLTLSLYGNGELLASTYTSVSTAQYNGTSEMEIGGLIGDSTKSCTATKINVRTIRIVNDDKVVLGFDDSFTSYALVPEIYSTQERKVGIWKDGRPLYQKTFTVDFTSDTSVELFASGIGHAQPKATSYIASNVLDAPFYLLNNTYVYCYIDVRDNGRMLLYNNYDGSIQWTITVQYTKLADSPGQVPIDVPITDLNELRDVDASSLGKGQILLFDSTTNKWKNSDNLNAVVNNNKVPFRFTYDTTTQKFGYLDGADTFHPFNDGGGGGETFEALSNIQPRGSSDQFTGRFYHCGGADGAYILTKSAWSTSRLINPLGTGSEKFKISLRVYFKSQASSQIVIGCDNGTYYSKLPSLEIMSDNRLGVGLSNTNSTSWNLWYSMSTVLQYNNYYRLELEWDGADNTIRVFDSNDNALEIKTASLHARPVNGSGDGYVVCGFGSGSHYASGVWLDLWNSYITVNGTMVWGSDQMGRES